VTTLLKGSLMPGSPMLLLIGVIVGAVLLIFSGTRTWGRRWLVLLGMSYWLMSTPIVANSLAGAVAGGAGPVDAARAADAAAIVVLDGGMSRYMRGDLTIDVPLEATIFRALEAARVYALLNEPLVIVTAGAVERGHANEGRALVEALADAGVPRERILLDSASANTRAHAVNVGRMLRERGISRFVLVTSATHIRRATMAFRQEGLEPIASAASLPSADTGMRMWRRLLPDLDSLRTSEEVWYDALGLTYYAVRGWV
jgi:uncharacterized SAM-binding protein YcdF (DUF218 family)